MNTNKIIIADIRSNCSYKGISTGHFVPVAKMYQKLFSKVADVVVAGGPVYHKYFEDRELLLLPNNVCGDSLKHKWLSFQNCRKLIKEAKGHTIIFQQSSDVTIHIALALFYHGGSKIFLIRYSKVGVASRFKRFIYSLCKHKVNGIICPNNEVGKAYERPYCIVPDYIYIGDANTNKFNSEKSYDFCMVGRIAEEKGIVEAAQRLAGTKYKVIIAGKTQTDELEHKLRNACEDAKNIELQIGYVSDEEYHRILAQSRYTILNYQGEYSKRSSGVVYDTLFNDVPVIGRKCKALQVIEDINGGILYNKIQDINFKTLLDEEYYKKFLLNISIYKEEHQQHILKLRKFVNS